MGGTGTLKIKHVFYKETIYSITANFILLYFLRQGFTTSFMLSLNLLYSSAWPQTCSNPPPSAS